MSDIVNLRLKRKQAKRHKAEQDAAERRLAHGRSKAAKALDRARAEKSAKDLERHRLERGD